MGGVPLNIDGGCPIKHRWGGVPLNIDGGTIRDFAIPLPRLLIYHITQIKLNIRVTYI